MNRKVIFYGILIIVNFIILEITSYYISIVFLAPRGIVYCSGQLNRDDFIRYNLIHDSLLGWTQGISQFKEVDISGSRKIPSFPDPQIDNSCISLYGDSYTWSNRNSAVDSWANQLSLLLNCRVSNFGGSGYGTDQAYLRYKLNLSDTAKIVVLNHFVFDILRNVNQYWGFRSDSKKNRLLFKPRFLLDDDQLKLVPIPNKKQIQRFLTKDELIENLEYDFFIPDGKSGLITLDFPYTYAFIKSLFHPKFQALIRGEPTHLEFYNSNHISGSLEITQAIIESFVELANSRKQIPIVTIIPYLNDFDYFNKTGKWSYQNLIKSLKKENIVVVNIGEKIIQLEKQYRFDHYYAGEGHFNKQGDALLSKIMFQYLKNEIDTTICN